MVYRGWVKFFCLILSIRWVYAEVPATLAVAILEEGRFRCEILEEARGVKNISSVNRDTGAVAVFSEVDSEEIDSDVLCVSSGQVPSDCGLRSCVGRCGLQSCVGRGYFLKVNGVFINRYILDMSKLSTLSTSTRLDHLRDLCERDKLLATTVLPGMG